MSSTFIDTSALVALKDSGDAHHEQALECLERIRRAPAARLILTNYVLSEVHGYFCRAPRVALEYVEHLRRDPLFQVVRALSRDEDRAVSILRSSRDKTYSFADAVSFAVMDRLELQAAFAFDRHFKQYGRQRILPSS